MARSNLCFRRSQSGITFVWFTEDEKFGTLINAHDHKGTKFIDDLAAVGLSVDDVDFVICTHLHADHVGWNTRLVDGRWVPTFPMRATCLLKPSTTSGRS